MTQAEELAAFVVRASYGGLSEAARAQLKIRVLDALGCAIGALEAEPIRMLRAQLEDFGGAGLCSLIGGGASADAQGRPEQGRKGGRAAPDRAALYNSALVRYLDFNDSYLAKGETCHPSDNLGAVLAAAEYAGLGGRGFLAALAVAYQVQCRLSDAAPVRAKGFDHTVQGCYALAAGVAKALGLDARRTAHAIAISGTAFNALRVTRTGALSHWKGLAYPNAAFCCTHAAFLAMRGVTGPLEVFEGRKGFMEAIAGPFEIAWESEDLERVTRTVLKKYNAEVHSQSAIEGILELRGEGSLGQEEDVERIEIETFDVAFDIIGGGDEGVKTRVRTKEEADHSLPYMAAAALLDGQVMPEQYLPERIGRADVQRLLAKVVVRPSAEFSRRFPAEMPCRVTIALRDGRRLVREKRDYEGFRTRPMSWEAAVAKFDRLSGRFATPSLRRDIVDAVRRLDEIRVADLADLLNNVHG
jgi:2-methylcitrate dehydratase